MKWTAIETQKFVKLYLSHECLWNPIHTNYKFKAKRLKAYRDMSTKFNDATGILLNVTEIKIKIKNLRSTYAQEMRKIKMQSGPTWTYIPNIKWFNDWDKCFSNVKKLTGDSSIDSNQDTSEDASQKIWNSQNDDNLDDGILEPFQVADHDYNIILKPEPREVPHIDMDRAYQHDEDLVTKYASKRKKKKERLRSSSSEQLDFRDSSDSNDKAIDDEFDIYGKYIASQLRKMGLKRALTLQLQIQSMVSEARIAELNVK